MFVQVSIMIPRPDGVEPLPIEPLGLVFLVVFAFILLIQFFAMLRHRWGTLLHILASTDIRCCRKKYDHKKAIREAVEYARMLQRLRGIDEDLTDQDYEYMSSSEGRPSTSGHLFGPNSVGDMMMGGGVGMLGGAGGGSGVGLHAMARGSAYDSDAPSASASEMPYPLMFQNQGYQDSTPNFAHLPPHGHPAAGGLLPHPSLETMEESLVGMGGKAGRRNRRHRSQIVDKNNTLRRAFVRRYTKLLRQHSADVGGESSINQFLHDTAQRTRANQPARQRETAEDLVNRFNRFNR